MTAKMSEQQVLEILNSFYRRYDDVELKSRTQINNEMEHKYPNWSRDPEQAEKIRRAVSGPLPIDRFNEDKNQVFDTAFKGWTVKQIEEFAKKYDGVLNNHRLMQDNINYKSPIADYAHRRKEEKMRKASKIVKEKLGDSMEFTKFDSPVKVFGGTKEVTYNDLKMHWQEEQQRYRKR